MRALQSTGAIHSDPEQGFIIAEVAAYEALTRCGSLAAARYEGLLRLEGKEYHVANGDALTLRFNI